jgi:hypothetical protein
VLGERARALREQRLGGLLRRDLGEAAVLVQHHVGLVREVLGARFEHHESPSVRARDAQSARPAPSDQIEVADLIGGLDRPFGARLGRGAMDLEDPGARARLAVGARGGAPREDAIVDLHRRHTTARREHAVAVEDAHEAIRGSTDLARRSLGHRANILDAQSHAEVSPPRVSIIER